MIYTDRLFWGIVIITVSFCLAVLLIMWAMLPNPHRGFTPPPLDRDGFTYSCYCWEDRVRVTILAEAQPRAKHARRARASLFDRIRSNSSPNARADGGGKGGTAPVPVAA